MLLHSATLYRIACLPLSLAATYHKVEILGLYGQVFLLQSNLGALKNSNQTQSIYVN